MRIATYNIEWFNALFDDAGQVLRDDSWSQRYNVTKAQQAHAIAHVLRRVDADAVMIIEAPDTSRGRDGVAALEQFANTFDLRTTKALIGFANDTQQEIALLYDPMVIEARHTPWASDGVPAFDQSFEVNLGIDAMPDHAVWSKPPLEVTVKAKGVEFAMIGVHAKSKAPHGAKDEAEAMRISIANRRKQLAQCTWLRRRIDAVLAQGRDLIVLGDFNDGPGLDKFEKIFGQSGVEIVLGGEGSTLALHDPHAALALCNRFAAPTTSRFWLHHEKRYLQALLDYVMVSRGVRDKSPRWRIWHPFEDPMCAEDQALHQALLAASDHFPVSFDVTL